MVRLLVAVAGDTPAVTGECLLNAAEELLARVLSGIVAQTAHLRHDMTLSDSQLVVTFRQNTRQRAW